MFVFLLIFIGSIFDGFTAQNQNQCDQQCLSSRYDIDHFLYHHDYVSYSQPLRSASLPENPVISRQCHHDTAIHGFFTKGLFARGSTKDLGHCLKSCLAIEQCESINFVPGSRDCYLSGKRYRNERRRRLFFWRPNFTSWHHDLKCHSLYQKSFRINSDPPRPNLAWSGREGVPIHTPWYKSKLLNNARATHAVPHSYPWIVSLSYEGSPYRCSGVLIANPYLENESNLILTAAHCVCEGKTNKIAEGLIVEVGKVHLNVRQVSEQEVQLKTISVHPHYDGTPWNGYDVALLYLKNPVRFNRYVSPVKLPRDGQKTPENKRKCLLAGWQLTRSKDNDDTRKSDIMQQIPVTILSDRQCKDHRTMFNLSPKKMRQYHFLCATNKNGAAKASCDGDSGGPLACKENGAFVLYGIVSYGTEDYACRRSTKPTIAMRVGDFLDWIKRETITLASRVG